MQKVTKLDNVVTVIIKALLQSLDTIDTTFSERNESVCNNELYVSFSLINRKYGIFAPKPQDNWLVTKLKNW